MGPDAPSRASRTTVSGQPRWAGWASCPAPSATCSGSASSEGAASPLDYCECVNENVPDKNRET
jgi:hypothetical protein